MKMFSTFFKATIAFLIFSSAASAQTIPLTYKATNGTPFSVKTAQKLSALPGSVNVLDETGYASTTTAATYYPDVANQVYNQITNDPAFKAEWLQLTGLQSWVNTAALKNVTCYAGRTTIVYRTGINPDTLADNCQFLSAYQARTN